MTDTHAVGRLKEAHATLVKAKTLTNSASARDLISAAMGKVELALRYLSALEGGGR